MEHKHCVGHQRCFYDPAVGEHVEIPASRLTFENAMKDWCARYVLMCDYLDEFDEKNYEHLASLVWLWDHETEWCSFDKRLTDVNIPNQKYTEDSEGCTYETNPDVKFKVAVMRRKLGKALRIYDSFQVKSSYDMVMENKDKIGKDGTTVRQLFSQIEKYYDPYYQVTFVGDDRKVVKQKEPGIVGDSIALIVAEEDGRVLLEEDCFEFSEKGVSYAKQAKIYDKTVKSWRMEEDYYDTDEDNYLKNVLVVEV